MMVADKKNEIKEKVEEREREETDRLGDLVGGGSIEEMDHQFER